MLAVVARNLLFDEREVAIAEPEPLRIEMDAVSGKAKIDVPGS